MIPSRDRARLAFGALMVLACTGCGMFDLREKRQVADDSPTVQRSDYVPPTCEDGESLCRTQCVSIQTDRRHCGDCDSWCEPGKECVGGECVYQCGPGRTPCGLAGCKDLSWETEHCGACDHRCASNERCSDGVCTCGPGYTVCNGACLVQDLSGPACDNCNQCKDVFTCTADETERSDWPTHAGNFLRNGYNARELGTPPLSDGWQVSVELSRTHPVIVAHGRVLVSGTPRFAQPSFLHALDVETGETVWNHDFGMVGNVGQVSVVDCRIYLQNGGGGGVPPLVWSLERDSGAASWSRTFQAQTGEYFSPTVTDTSIYAYGGSYGGLQGVARDDGELLFLNQNLEQRSYWFSAFYNGHVYTFLDGNLRRHHATAGWIESTVSIPVDGVGIRKGPVFSDDGKVLLVESGVLRAYQAETAKQLWQRGFAFQGTPAVAEGLVLALYAGQLIAYELETGNLLWTASETESLGEPPVAAHGFGYVSSVYGNKTYAIDLRDGSVVWQAPVSGRLSIGNGRLFVVEEQGVVHSYVLTQPSAETDGGI